MSSGEPRRAAAAAAALALLAVGWLFPGLGRVGLTWDEPMYFASAGRIQEWTAEVVHGPDRARTLGAERIREVWDADHYWNPHPPVYKEAMALTEWLASSWLDPIRGFRLASALWFGLLVAVLTWTAGRAWGVPAGLGAGLSLLLMPRLFGHGHFGATDTPSALFWFAAAAGLASACLYGRRGGLWLGGLALGLGMGTKFTGWLLPIPALVWLLLYRRRSDALLAFAGWIAIGMIAAWLLNPMAWHDPVGYVSRLFSESLARREAVPIYTFYRGRQYGFDVPWHHPIAMTLATVPLPLLALSLVGTAAVLVRPARDPLGGMAVLMVLFFWTLLALPSSPNHDGVRLFLAMFPFVALLAGRGFGRLAERLRASLPGRAAVLGPTLLGAAFLYPPYVQTTRIAPLWLSYYNELIGGARGASRAGMELTYWYDAITPDFLERLNGYLPRDARLGTFPHSFYFQSLQTYGLLREDIVLVDEWPVPYYLILARKAVFGPLQWAVYDNVRPVLSVALDGEVLAGLYAWEAPTDAHDPPADPATGDPPIPAPEREGR